MFQERIDIEGNVTEESGFDSDGSTTINYSLSSVVTITIDGKQIFTKIKNIRSAG